jgi:hypothetical protein
LHGAYEGTEAEDYDQITLCVHRSPFPSCPANPLLTAILETFCQEWRSTFAHNECFAKLHWRGKHDHVSSAFANVIRRL